MLLVDKGVLCAFDVLSFEPRLVTCVEYRRGGTYVLSATSSETEPFPSLSTVRAGPRQYPQRASLPLRNGVLRGGLDGGRVCRMRE
jgi:hypothetical protein